MLSRVSKNCSNCAKSSHLVTLGHDKWGCLTDDLIIALVSSHHERCPFVNITCVEVGLVRQKEQKAFNGVLKSCWKVEQAFVTAKPFESSTVVRPKNHAMT